MWPSSTVPFENVHVPLNGRFTAHRLSPTGTPIEARPYTARYSSYMTLKFYKTKVEYDCIEH